MQSPSQNVRSCKCAVKFLKLLFAIIYFSSMKKYFIVIVKGKKNFHWITKFCRCHIMMVLILSIKNIQLPTSNLIFLIIRTHFQKRCIKQRTKSDKPPLSQFSRKFQTEFTWIVTSTVDFNLSSLMYLAYFWCLA